MTTDSKCTCDCGGVLCAFCEANDLGECNTELDALAEAAGLNLRLDLDRDAPLLWAVWSHDGNGSDEDIIGAGDSPSAALEDARKTIRGWEAARDEKNSDAWTAHNREPSR